MEYLGLQTNEQTDHLITESQVRRRPFETEYVFFLKV